MRKKSYIILWLSLKGKNVIMQERFDKLNMYSNMKEIYDTSKRGREGSVG
jgi:hypothetical protein